MRHEAAIPRGAGVSGNADHTPHNVTMPSATNATKIERQPNHAPRNPPTAGPIPGARLCTMVSHARGSLPGNGAVAHYRSA